MRTEDVNKIIIHCAATRPSQDIDAAEIDRWHRGNGWLKIGYHFVIKRDGTVEVGRKLGHAGAHAKGHNGSSWGICMVGGVDEDLQPENNFTEDQFQSLVKVILELQQLKPTVKIIGHNEVSNKACPSFDVQEWLDSILLPRVK